LFNFEEDRETTGSLFYGRTPKFIFLRITEYVFMVEKVANSSHPYHNKSVSWTEKIMIQSLPCGHRTFSLIPEFIDFTASHFKFNSIVPAAEAPLTIEK